MEIVPQKKTVKNFSFQFLGLGFLPHLALLAPRASGTREELPAILLCLSWELTHKL